MKNDKQAERENCIQTIKQIMRNQNITLTTLKDSMNTWDEDINK